MDMKHEYVAIYSIQLIISHGQTTTLLKKFYIDYKTCIQCLFDIEISKVPRQTEKL